MGSHGSDIHTLHAGRAFLDHVRRIAALACASLTLIAASPQPPAGPGESAAAAQPPNHDGDSRAPLQDLLGSSGNLRALIATPDSLARSRVLRPLLAGIPVEAPGIHTLAVTAPNGDSLVVVSLKPLGPLKSARIGNYHVGHWPAGGVAGRSAAYAPPAGFIPVTPENQTTLVSKHFLLRDFLTHDQSQVWPKVLVLRVPLVDKLELISAELERRGLPGKLHVMSGFRTPQYNAQGVGAKGGRAGASRHMYGDAADVFVDADDDGVMDDLDGDGRITVNDARVLLGVAAGVEALHPDLVGGLSAYPANSAHGPFVHVDARGFRARW